MNGRLYAWVATQLALTALACLLVHHGFPWFALAPLAVMACRKMPW